MKAQIQTLFDQSSLKCKWRIEINEIIVSLEDNQENEFSFPIMENDQMGTLAEIESFVKVLTVLMVWRLRAIRNLKYVKKV